MATLEEARGAKAEALFVFRALTGRVVGVGIEKLGEGYGLKVNLSEMPSGVELPGVVNCVPVRVEVVGRINGA